MSNVLVNEEYLEDIADAIRLKNGSSDTYTPGQMAEAIGNIEAGSSATLIAKTVTANGTYAAEDDSADGYSSVTVSVPTYPMSGNYTQVTEPSLSSTTFSAGKAAVLAQILNLSTSAGEKSSTILYKGNDSTKGLSVNGSGTVYITTTNGSNNINPGLGGSGNIIVRYACTDLAGIALWNSGGGEPMTSESAYYCGWALCTDGHYDYFVGDGYVMGIVCDNYSYYDPTPSTGDSGTRAYNIKPQSNRIMLSPLSMFGVISNNLLFTSMYPNIRTPMTFTMGGHTFVGGSANTENRSRLVVRLGALS